MSQKRCGDRESNPGPPSPTPGVQPITPSPQLFINSKVMDNKDHAEYERHKGAIPRADRQMLYVYRRLADSRVTLNDALEQNDDWENYKEIRKLLDKRNIELITALGF